MARLTAKTRRTIRDKGLQGMVEAVHDIAVLEAILPQFLYFLDEKAKGGHLKPIILKNLCYNESLNQWIDVFFNRISKL